MFAEENKIITENDNLNSPKHSIRKYIKIIRFTEGELKELESLLKSNNCNFSKFARSCIFSKKDNNALMDLEILKNISFKIQSNLELIKELKRIGNNLNQIAKLCNKNKKIDFIIFTELERALKIINELIIEIKNDC